MRIFNFLVLFAIFVKAKSQVLKGTEVDPEDLKFLVYLKPWFAFIDEKGKGWWAQKEGAGTIVHPNWILTAAHLVTDQTEVIENHVRELFFNFVDAVVGTKDKTDANAQRIRIEHGDDVYVHEKYDDEYFNDIALLYLKVALVRSKTLEPARLLTSKMNFEYGANCVVAGWGSHEFKTKQENSDDDQSEELKYMTNGPNHALQGKLKLLKPRKCLKKYKAFYVNPKKQFCYGCTQGSCSQTGKGDSGSPVVCAFQRKKHHLKNTSIKKDSKTKRKDLMRFQDDDPMKYQYVFAVHSFGCSDLNHKCTSEGPSVGTNVGAKEIEKWIRDTIKPGILNSDINSFVIAAATIAASICIYFL